MLRKNKVKISSLAISIIFSLNALLSQGVLAQSACPMPPSASAMVPLGPTYHPPIIKGLIIKPNKPLECDFIVDQGDSGLEGDDFRNEAHKLIKYFLTSLTVPEEDLWVNLSPYEQDRIIPDGFGDTEMGRDLLVQDYLLKQITSTLMYPEGKTGKNFWEKIYKKTYEIFGQTDIPLNTFNKIWIMPRKAKIFQNKDRIYIVESALKVLLEEDYIAFQKATESKSSSLKLQPSLEERHKLKINKEIIREIIIPALEKEVNYGKTFAPLRQIYHSIILSTWFKENLKNSLMHKVFINKRKVGSIAPEDKKAAHKIYNQYLDAFRRGVYDLIKEEYDPITQKIVNKKYFSGGIIGKMDTAMISETNNFFKEIDPAGMHLISSSFLPQPIDDFAMKTNAFNSEKDIVMFLNQTVGDVFPMAQGSLDERYKKIKDFRKLLHVKELGIIPPFLNSLISIFDEVISNPTIDLAARISYLDLLWNFLGESIYSEDIMLSLFEKILKTEKFNSLDLPFFVDILFFIKKNDSPLNDLRWIKIIKTFFSIDRKFNLNTDFSLHLFLSVEDFSIPLVEKTMDYLESEFYIQQAHTERERKNFAFYKERIITYIVLNNKILTKSPAVKRRMRQILKTHASSQKTMTIDTLGRTHSLSGYLAAELLLAYPEEVQTIADPYFQNYLKKDIPLDSLSFKTLELSLPHLRNQYFILGRTLFSKDKDDKWVGLKIMKKGEQPQELLLMATNLKWIAPHKKNLKLRYPQSYSIDGKDMFIINADEIPSHIKSNLSKQEIKGKYTLDLKDNHYTIVKYALPSESENFSPENFFQYAHDPRISIEEFDQMTFDSLHDLIYFFHLNVGYESIGDLFHIQDKKRRYLWNVDALHALSLLNQKVDRRQLQGAGRMDRLFSSNNGPVTYTDQRRKMLADQGDMRSIDDINISEPILFESGLQNNFIKKFTLLGEYLFVFILNKMQHLVNKGLLDDEKCWKNESGFVFKNLENFLYELINQAAQRYLDNDMLFNIFKKNISPQLQYKRLTMQLLFYYSKAYKEYFNRGEIPSNIYSPELEVFLPDLKENIKWGVFTDKILEASFKSQNIVTYLKKKGYIIQIKGFYKFSSEALMTNQIMEDDHLLTNFKDDSKSFLEFFRNYSGGWRDNLVDEDGGPFNGPLILFDIPELFYRVLPVIMTLKEHPDKKEEIIHAAIDIGGEKNLDQTQVGGIDLNPKNINLKAEGLPIDFVLPENIEEMENISGFIPDIFSITPIKNLQLLFPDLSTELL